MNFFWYKLQNSNKTSQNVKPALQNHIVKTFNLELNLSLISNKALNLYSRICPEINATSIKNKTLL